MDYGILFQGNTSPFGLKPGASVDGLDVGPNTGAQYLQTPALSGGAAGAAPAPKGILEQLQANPDLNDALIQAGAGLLSSGNLRQGLAQGFAGFNKGLDDAAQRRIATRKLSLEELKANKPSVTPAGVPGHVLLTYPDGRTETVVNDAAVQAYEAQQKRVDDRQQAQLDSRERTAQMQIDAQNRRLDATIANQNSMLDKRLQGGGRLNPTLQKSEDTDIEAIQGAQGIIAATTPLIANLEDGSLKLGALRNAWNSSKNFFGKSTPESDKYAELQREVTRITNEALRLNKGVQTEGDAERASKELQASFAKNDSTIMAKALRDLQEINRRAATNKAKLVDQRRTSQGVTPLYGGQSPVDAGAPAAANPNDPLGLRK
jgi:hypothetical protein